MDGLCYMHSKSYFLLILTILIDILHRDLKPFFLILANLYCLRENILMSNEGILKICDFGSSKKVDLDGKNTPYIVSRYYRAPELFLCMTNYTSAIDM